MASLNRDPGQTALRSPVRVQAIADLLPLKVALTTDGRNLDHVFLKNHDHVRAAKLTIFQNDIGVLPPTGNFMDLKPML
jgi:hypothetical protein